MVLKNPLPVLSFCSLILGALLFALAALFPVSAPAVNRVAEGPLFAVLELDQAAADRETAAALNQALNLEASGRETLSESSQWVLLNDFNRIIRVPLDQYEDRVEAFDPRNDGFAGRLRSFFVRNGKRYFFIPLDDSALRFDAVFRPALYRSVEKTVRDLMGETPHTLIFPGEASLRAAAASVKAAAGRGFSGLYLLCYLLAGLGLCFLLRPRLLAFHLVPPLAGLSLLGSPGFAMGAILCLLAGLLLEPVREICFSLRFTASFGRKERGFLAGIRRSGFPYRFHWLLGLSLAGIYVLSAVLGKAGPLLAAGSFAAFMGIFFSYFTLETRNRGGHVPFVPVIIMETRAGPEFPKTMLPFACASLISAVFSLSSFDFDPPRPLAWLDEIRQPEAALSGGSRWEAESWPAPISAAEYEAHALFQSGFSLLPLGAGFAQPGYYHYNVGQDGLITDVSPGLQGLEGDIPPFSLEGFMAFLENQVFMEADDLRGGGSSLAGFFPALCTLLICIPAFAGPARRGGGKRKPSLYNDKRVAA